MPTIKELTSIDKVCALLHDFGRKVDLMPDNGCPYDLLVDNKIRIELKTSRFRKVMKSYGWTFNIHRHDKLNEGNVDFYILRFEGIPGMKYAAHALIKSPVNKYVLSFTLKQLIEGKLSSGFANFNKFKKNTFSVYISYDK